MLSSYFKVTKPLDPQNKTNIQDLLLLENIYTHFQAFGIKKNIFSPNQHRASVSMCCSTAGVYDSVECNILEQLLCVDRCAFKSYQFSE